MNKQLIVAAAAAMLMAPVASYAVDAKLYGSIRAGLVSGDDDLPNSGRRLDLGATGQDGDLNGQGLYSRIGVKGSSDLGNGLSAGLHLERGVGETLSVRHTNVWLSGGFGKLTFGQQNNPYRQARNWDQSWFLGGQYGFGDGGSRLEGIRYDMSNGPFKLAVMATAKDNQTDSPACTDSGVNVCTMDETAAGGVTYTRASRVRLEHDDGVDSWVIAAGYDFGVVNLNVAHRTNNTDVEVSALTSAGTVGSNPTDPADAAAARTSAINAAEALVDDEDRSSDNTAIGLNGSFGSVGWYLSYQTSSDNASNHENDVDSIGGFLSFKPSESDTLYFYHVNHSADRERRGGTDGAVDLGESPTETIFGYSHSFGAGVSFHAEYLSIDNDLPSGADDGSDPSTLVLAMKVDF